MSVKWSPKIATPAISSPPAAKPFLKWVGGKGQLIEQLGKLLPESFNNYFEPFVGGGAVFFHLYNAHKLTRRAYLFDNNRELINAYLVIRDHLRELKTLLKAHEVKHNKAHYYHIRNLDRNGYELNTIEKAARTIYLNRTCYNGLYRVNKNGQFNVPIGRYKNPKILFPEILDSVSLALQNVHIDTLDFREITTYTKPGDFIYFDPPYVPLSPTSNFTSYTRDSFALKDQEDLANVCNKLTKQGCKVMLSNSSTPAVRELYKGYRIETVYAKRAVNSNGNSRGKIKELVILNY